MQCLRAEVATAISCHTGTLRQSGREQTSLSSCHCQQTLPQPLLTAGRLHGHCIFTLPSLWSCSLVSMSLVLRRQFSCHIGALFAFPWLPVPEWSVFNYILVTMLAFILSMPKSLPLLSILPCVAPTFSIRFPRTILRPPNVAVLLFRPCVPASLWCPSPCIVHGQG